MPFHLGKITALIREMGVVVEGQDAEPYDMANRAAHAGDTVFMGPFDDAEQAVLALFHELGHVSSARDRPPFNKWPHPHHDEALAWERGFELADQCGIEFSARARAWAAGELATYFEDDNPERSPMRFLPRALAVAGLMEAHSRRADAIRRAVEGE